MKKFLIILPLLFLLLSCEKEFQETTVQEAGKKIKPNSLMGQGDGPGDGGGTGDGGGSGGGDIEEEDDGGDDNGPGGGGGSNSTLNSNAGFVAYAPDATYRIKVNYKRLPSNVLTSDGVSITKIGGPASMTITNKSYFYTSNQNMITFTVMGTLVDSSFGGPPVHNNFVNTISINVSSLSYTAN